jgi:predicted NBD/HSP70 family sugar kinase
LAGWAGVTANDFGTVLGCPVRLENEANLAAWGEHVFGAGRGRDTTLLVKLHSGVGAGIVIDGRLFTGTGGAAELGHVPVDRNGLPCRCGKRGCLDTRASIPALLEQAADLGVTDMPALLQRVVDGDTAVRRLVRHAASLVGRALVPACMLLIPERVILVGALSHAGDVVIDPIRSALQAAAMPGAQLPPDVVLGQFTDRATAMGSSALALQRAGWLRNGDMRH